MKTFTRDETEHGVKYYLASEVDALLAGIGAQPATEIQAKYSLDDDPMGIRARVVDTVLGALTLGAQGTNKPPEGHWLGPVWDLARAQEPADKPDNVNVLIDGDEYEVPMPVACEMLRLNLLIKQPSQDYAAKNPLGGPAKVFDAMAAAIRAGDSYESVLGGYGFAEVGAAPVFWYRPVGEDGGYEGPIHNSRIEKVRSMGGTWVPLIAGTALTAPLPVQPAQGPVTLTDAINFFIEEESMNLWKRGYSDTAIANITQAVLQKLRDASPAPSVSPTPGQLLSNPKQLEREPLTDDQRKAIVVIFSSGKVSVSEVQRKLEISYDASQELCQSIVDLGITHGLRLAPSLSRNPLADTGKAMGGEE